MLCQLNECHNNNRFPAVGRLLYGGPRENLMTENIKSFLSSAGSTIVSVEFIKKDGTVRRIQFNPRDRREIVGVGRTNPNPDVICVRDFSIAKNNNGVRAWRSFNAKNVTKIVSNGITHSFD